jgi:hypothetical protein
MSGINGGKVLIVALSVGLVAAFSATAVYPLFIQDRKATLAKRHDDLAKQTDNVPGGSSGGFERKSMWGNADAAAKGK